MPVEGGEFDTAVSFFKKAAAASMPTSTTENIAMNVFIFYAVIGQSREPERTKTRKVTSAHEIKRDEKLRPLLFHSFVLSYFRDKKGHFQRQSPGTLP